MGLLDPVDGRRHDYLVPSVVYVPKPAASGGFSYATPGSVFQEIISCSFDLVTSAVVGNRTPVLEVIDGTGRAIVAAAAGWAVTASSTARYSFVRGLSEWDTAGVSFASGPIFRVPIVMGEAITLAIDGVQAGDQVSNIALVFLAEPTDVPAQ